MFTSVLEALFFTKIASVKWPVPVKSVKYLNENQDLLASNMWSLNIIFLSMYVSIWKSVKCNPVFNLEMNEHFHATAYHFGYIIYRRDIHYCFDKLVHSPLIT